MKLNKDLFGKIPVTPVSDNPASPAEQPKWDGAGWSVYHGSPYAPEEFLKAPAIHMGTADQAAQVLSPNWAEKRDDEGFLYDTPEEVPGVNEFQFSKHSRIHPPLLTDAEANAAHAQFLESKGHMVPPSVQASRQRDGYSSRVARALGALHRGEILKYRNDVEGPTGAALHSLYESDLDERDIQDHFISYIVPAPSMNLVQFGHPDPKTQPTLPMDFTDALPESQQTRQHREERESWKR